MGKSYKKNPVFKDNVKVSKLLKRQANKKVRRYLKNDILSNGKSYRKVFNPWDIHDIIIRSTYEDEVEYINFIESLCNCGVYDYEDKWVKETLSYSYNDWYKSFKRK